MERELVALAILIAIYLVALILGLLNSEEYGKNNRLIL